MFELFEPASMRAVKVKLTLRLAVYRQSVRLGAKPLEARDQIFFDTLWGRERKRKKVGEGSERHYIRGGKKL
jgi:hypothetical protein